MKKLIITVVVVAVSMGWTHGIGVQPSGNYLLNGTPSGFLLNLTSEKLVAQ